ncbi:MAG: DUF11 domain-containing protein [Desulfobacterales bacterium]|nr:DUF11 domain-containing protein [Desulfobacterales bacterium]
MRQKRFTNLLKLPVLCMVLLVLAFQTASADSPAATSASYQLFRDVEASAGKITSASYAMTGIAGEPSPSDSVTSTGYALRPGYKIITVIIVANDTYSTNEDTALTVAADSGILVNDTGDSLAVSEFTEPSHGSLELNSDGSFTYTPEDDWNGADTFTYKAGDGVADSETASVEITVTAADDPPYVAKPLPDIKVHMNSDDVPTDLAGVFSDIDSDDTEIEISVLSNSDPSLVSANITEAPRRSSDSGTILTLAFAPNKKGDAVIVIRGTSEGKTADEDFTVTVGDTTDADNDGLFNLSEFVSMTDPSDPDSDNDGATDGSEIMADSDPLDIAALPGTEPADSDKNGIPDWWEKRYGLDSGNTGDASDDTDGDGLTNREEFFGGTDPQNPDTDGDGAGDGEEAENEDDPLNPIRVTAFTDITDENGGRMMPGDETEFTVTLTNGSSAPLKGAQLEIPLPGYTAYIETSIITPEGSTASENESSLLVTGIDIPAHGQVTVSFRATVDATGTVLPPGTENVTVPVFILEFDSDGDGINESIQKTDADASDPGKQPDEIQAVIPVATCLADNITYKSANLNGILNPGGLETKYYFEYGLTGDYGMTTPETYAGSGYDNLHANTRIIMLDRETSYHCRVVTVNSSGVTYGQNTVFRTLYHPGNPFAPGVGQTGSTAVHMNDPSITAWASGWQEPVPYRKNSGFSRLFAECWQTAWILLLS